jgi:alkylation response protein AidB-like acyl-CoA dehydrogenase
MILTAMDSACIVRNGSEQLKRRILPKAAAGKLKMCFAVTEANAGTNTFRISTHARKRSDGKSYVINGEKTFITGADAADLMLLVTRTTTAQECKDASMPKTYGLSLFLVDPKGQGVRLSPLRTRGIEGFQQFTVVFENAEVPAENLVGEENGGAMAMFNSLNPERILAAAIACGMSRHLIQKSVDYANTRKVFGDKPIGAYQAVAHPLADLQMELDATRHLVYRAAWSFDRQDDLSETGYWATAAKYKGAELAIACADRAIQTHGGSGFDEDVGIVYYWDAARLLRTAPINKEMILNFVGEHRLGLPRSY